MKALPQEWISVVMAVIYSDTGELLLVLFSLCDDAVDQVRMQQKDTYEMWFLTLDFPALGSIRNKPLFTINYPVYGIL